MSDDNTTWDELFHRFVRYSCQVYVSDSYFLCLTKESKQRKSSQKKPAHRTWPALPGFLAGPPSLLTK